MAFTPELDPGESLIFQDSYHASKESRRFAFAVSTHALHLPGKKLIARSDPWFFRRVPVTEVQSVELRRLRSIGLLLLAALMVVVGVVTTVLMVMPLLRGQGGKVSGYPVAVIVGGLVIPFAARGRVGLVVRHSSGRFRWKPPLVIDRASRRRIKCLLEDIIAACREAGAPVKE